MELSLTPKWWPIALVGEWRAYGGKLVGLATDTFDKFSERFLGARPIKWGHEEPATTGTPAAGAVLGLRRVGNALEGLLAPSPELVSAVRNNQFFNCSIEATLDPPEFLGLAVLGAKNPAVVGMPPLSFAAPTDGRVMVFASGGTQPNALIEFLAAEATGDPRVRRACDYALAHGVSFTTAARETAE